LADVHAAVDGSTTLSCGLADVTKRAGLLLPRFSL